jgi:flavin-dependent dehydrogenase
MQVTIVGAGLSGLTAAIALAREGRAVVVYERKPGPGGAARELSDISRSEYAFTDTTPFDIDALSRYAGFSLDPAQDPDLPPWCAAMPYCRFYCYGRQYDMHFPEAMHMKYVERGARASSLDSFLYRRACEAGVDIRFGVNIESAADFTDLPENTILATGMFRQTYEALGLPYIPAWGFFSKIDVRNYDGPGAITYFNQYTREYGYFTTLNGAGGAILFQRGAPPSGEGRQWFADQLCRDEGISAREWHETGDIAATPTGSINNPRLFHDRFILTGTLAGYQDPAMVLGVHGAVVSGKIAALALTDRETAQQEFDRLLKGWRVSYRIKRILDALHPNGQRLLLYPLLRLSPLFDPRQTWRFFPAVPGLGRL